jgi:hypothetical protein
MATKGDATISAPRTARQRVVALVCVALGLGLLTFCGGKTDEGSGGSAGQSGFAGDGFGGHTAACLRPPYCGGPCGLCPGQGGFGGEGGFGGDAGFGGEAGFGGTGFAGHTSGCVNNPCEFGCGQCAGRGGNAGFAGQAGFSGQTGFGGHTSSCLGTCGGNCPPCPPDSGTKTEAGSDAAVRIADAAVEASSAQASPMAAASAITPQACYVLSGYEPDPCLPIDDSLLPWLSNVPRGCAAHVTAGPFVGVDDPQGRTCCYSLACE